MCQQVQNSEILSLEQFLRQKSVFTTCGEMSIGERKAAFRNLKKQCYYCEATENLTIEHKLARSLGGTNNRNNIVLACVSCNNKKSAEESRQVREAMTRYYNNVYLPIQQKKLTKD